jgi:hypothetical protein
LSSATQRKVFFVFLISILLYHWRILIGHQFSVLTGYEGTNQAYAWFTFLVRAIRTNTSYLWDPYAFSGHPFVDEMNNGAFYPINLLTSLVPLNAKGVFSPALYHWIYALTRVAAAWFMFLLLRELGAGMFAAFLAGLGFGLGGVMQHSGGWPHLYQGFIWFPLIFLFTLRAMKRNSLLDAAIAGLGIALALLAGSFYSGVAQAIMVITMVAYAAPTLRGAMIVGVAGLTAFCGSAAQLLPTLAAGSYTLRTLGPTMIPGNEKIPYQYVDAGQYAHSFIGLFVAPFAFNANLGSGEIASPYIGALLFLLALIGVWKCWDNRWVRYLTFVTVGAFVSSMGSISILHGVLYAIVPKMWMAREPTRILYLADFAVAALSAFGVDALFSKGAEEWGRLFGALKWLCIVCGIALLADAVVPKMELSPWLTLSLVLLPVSAALIWRVAAGDRTRGIQYLLAGVLLFDLYAFNWDAANVMEYQAKNMDQLDHLMTFKNAADFLKRQPGPWRVTLLADPISNIGDAYGIEATWGAAATVLQDYWRYRDLNIWNARYLIKPAAAADPNPVYHDPQWKVYEDAGASPRAWIVHKTIVEPAADKQELAIRTSDLRQTAVLSRAVNASGTPDADRVDLKNYRASAPVVSVYSASPALLVLSEVDVPGWVATVNSEEAEIVRVDGVLRGIPIPAGNSRVELRYRPVPVYLGAVLTMLTFLLVLAGRLGFLSRIRGAS